MVSSARIKKFNSIDPCFELTPRHSCSRKLISPRRYARRSKYSVHWARIAWLMPRALHDGIQSGTGVFRIVFVRNCLGDRRRCEVDFESMESSKLRALAVNLERALTKD